MKAKRRETEEAIRKFIEKPEGAVLELDVGWGAQVGYTFPKHLTDGDGAFLCGTTYRHEENTDGRAIKIALAGSHAEREPTHSVRFMFSDYASFVLCRKCLKWLREQLKPLENYEQRNKEE